MLPEGGDQRIEDTRLEMMYCLMAGDGVNTSTFFFFQNLWTFSQFFLALCGRMRSKLGRVHSRPYIAL